MILNVTRQYLCYFFSCPSPISLMFRKVNSFFLCILMIYQKREKIPPFPCMLMTRVCVIEALNEDLSRLDAWLISNKLSFNVANTQSMLASTKAKRKALDKSNQNRQVKVHGTTPAVISKIKYLGVLLDNSLDWRN